MRFWVIAFASAILAHPAFGFAPTVDQSDVSIRFESPEQNLLIVEGRTYTLRFDLTIAAITQFQAGDETLIGKYALLPTLNTGAVKGPGRVRIERFGPHLCEVRLPGLTWTDFDADIEIVLYCYAKRVFANVEVVPRGESRDLEVGWLGSVVHAVDILSYEDDYAVKLVQGGVRPRVCALVPRQLTPDGQGVPTRIALNPPDRLMIGSRYAAGFEGVRRAAVILVAGETHEDLVGVATVEASAARYQFDVSAGRFNGYNPLQGYFEIAAEIPKSGGTADSPISPVDDYTLDLSVAAPKELPPASLICRIGATSELPGAAVLVDRDAYPLPVPVQVSRIGDSASTGGKQSLEAYAPVTVSPGNPFTGGVRLVFDKWGRLPLEQLASVDDPQPMLQTALGRSTAFSYIPFKIPSEDRRSYVVLPSGSLHGSNTPLCGIRFLRYKSGGRWVENRLLDTRVYLTSPIAANFGLYYVSDDGRVKTTIDVFESPQDDQARSFIKLVIDVLEPVMIDDGSARHLRILGAGAYDVHSFWPNLAYTSTDGSTVVIAVGTETSWPLEAVPMAEGPAFVAAYARPEGNLAYVVNRVSGVIGGNPVSAFGLSSPGGDQGEFFLTAPENLERLEAGDYLEAHLFVMPFANGDSDYHPAEVQTELYGKGLATLKAIHGKGKPGFPLAMRSDPRGFVEFEIQGGSGRVPVFIDGFKSHRGFMLWEKVGGDWLFRDQQVHGNDWYQTFRAEDESVGVVISVETLPGESHHYAVGQASSAKTITLRNEFVTIHGGPLDFVSPVRFGGLINAPLEGTSLIRCSGLVNEAMQE